MSGTSSALKAAKERTIGVATNVIAAAAPAAGRHSRAPIAWRSRGVSDERRIGASRQTRSLRPNTATRPVVSQKMPHGWWQ